MERIGENDVLDARDALGRILAAGLLSTSPKLEAFLRYVVVEELEGRGDGISAYSIAVHALDRPASFDPQSDPVVRVFAGRLRTVLADYYDGPGKADLVRIGIPKGSYRPEFTRQQPSPSAALVEENSAPEAPHSRARRLAVSSFIAVMLIAAGAIAYLLSPLSGERLLSSNGSADTANAEITFPIVEVLPFLGGPDPYMGRLLEGIRQQLVLDLSQFRSVRVRNMLVAEDRSPAIKKSDFRVTGRFMNSGAADVVEIAVLETDGGSILWKEILAVPRNDAEYQELLLTAVRAIAPRVAGISGIVQSDAVMRLERRRTELGNAKTSDYECIVQFYDVVQRYSAEREKRTRQCLAELTTNGSRDSMVWALWALTRYIDWVRHDQGDPLEILSASLIAGLRAVELDPANASAHEYVAMTYAAMGEMDAARESFERALTLNPSKPDFYFHYGTYFIKLGEWERGVELVQQGLALSPAPPGWMYIPVVVDAFRRDDFEESLRLADKIIAMGDDRGYLQALAAAIALNDGRDKTPYIAGFRQAYGEAFEQPLAEMARIFRDEELVLKYQRALASVFAL
ncbi:tetratricopeptide repeat protein [Oricola sp.]|uniref:tetratricopeptide repeat protein n=1 Tax=Oricola sp. TaxID=1979950 RepID=UPI003514F234